METIVIDATDDYWTCDAWQFSGVWTTKNYALTQGIESGGDRDHVPLDSHWVRWMDRRRRGCGALNPVLLFGSIPIKTCRRCGMYRGPGGYKRRADS